LVTGTGHHRKAIVTKNRAAKLAARTIAADQDVRRPEAAYMDDRRKLRLPDGAVHNFADSTLRPTMHNEDAQRLWVAHIMREAASRVGHSSSTAATPRRGLRGDRHQAAGPA
jgi:hypothetical protein